ncbi:MAG: DUF2851 family protein [Dehalococcoidia bacterium]
MPEVCRPYVAGSYGGSCGSAVRRCPVLRERRAGYGLPERGTHRARAVMREGHRPPGPVGDGGGRLSEEILHSAWRRAGDGHVLLRSRDGRSYRVVYPGRPGGSLGPDFRDAIIERDDGVRLFGDVEIHVRAGDWRQHGHHRDPRYNGVVFHVALDTGDADSTTNAAGVRIPLLPIGPALVSRTIAPRPPAIPVLDLGMAGDQRFAARSSGLEVEIQAEGPDQALYAAVLECLGYPRNKSAFRQLAQRVPWQQVVQRCSGAGSADHDLATLLMWAAGLGPKPYGTGKLPGKPPAWTRPAGRPANDPRRRVPAAAALAALWLSNGGPAAAIESAIKNAAHAKDLAAHFTVGQASGQGAAALVGTGRAGEIVVNAVLPGVHALARIRGDKPLARRCEDLYREHPRLPENAITREARTLLAAHGVQPEVPGAREQQGLLFLYRSMSTKIVRPRQLPLL